jgi:hypothetical protein
LPLEIGQTRPLVQYQTESAVYPFLLLHLEGCPSTLIDKILQRLLHALKNPLVG